MKKIFPGLTITADRIDYKGHGGPLAGCRAAVDTAGDIEKRFTATRIVTLGVFGLKKKKIDRRELYLAVEGVGFAFVAEIEPKYGAQARKIAAKINSLGQVHTVDGPSASASATDSVSDEIAKLAALHASGALTDDEFSTAKDRLLR
jgi:hypothetical protein